VNVGEPGPLPWPAIAACFGEGSFGGGGPPPPLLMLSSGYNCIPGRPDSRRACCCCVVSDMDTGRDKARWLGVSGLTPPLTAAAAAAAAMLLLLVLLLPGWFRGPCVGDPRPKGGGMPVSVSPRTRDKLLGVRVGWNAGEG
jgi:hypothetical protein